MARERASPVAATLHARSPSTPLAESSPEPELGRQYESVEERARVEEILRAPKLAKWRGIYRGGGPARLRLDGPVVDAVTEPGSVTPYRVVESRDDHARIVVEHGQVVVLAWVRHADFEPQPHQRVALSSTPGKAPADGVGHLEIAPGERIEVLRTKDEWHEVELVRRSVRGWLPVAVFAPVFPVDAFPPTTNAGGIARSRTRVLERPGGRSIWRLPAGENAVHIVRESKEWVEIVFVKPCDTTIRVTGWVRRRDVVQFHGRMMGFGCGEISILEPRRTPPDAIEVTLPDGTELFDDVGRLVGLAREGNRLLRTPDGTLLVPSRWGPIPVVAEVEATVVTAP